MNITINGEPHTAPECATLAGALSTLGVVIERGVAVAVNDRVVPREKIPAFQLKPDDKILLITATQGG
jgi:sulfur carrier protein